MLPTPCIATPRLTPVRKEKLMKLSVEIRPGEGGMDAKLLCEKQAAIYARYAQRHGIKTSIASDEG